MGERSYRRIHLRVPIRGEALLKDAGETFVTATAIDISKGGLALAEASHQLEASVYQITITLKDGRTISLSGELIRQTESVAAFRTVSIDNESLAIIADLVFRFQETPEFIKQLETYDLFSELYVDEDGNELEITFEIDGEGED